MNSQLQTNVQPLLVCPECKGALGFSPALITCLSCELRFPQPSKDYVDLFSSRLLEREVSHWLERQQGMEKWYGELLTEPWAGASLARDYDLYASIFASLSGTVLDIGGGAGLVRQYLAPETGYVVLEPSLSWLAYECAPIAEQFPCVAATPVFIRGLGEYLPFADQVFDAVLALWTINHVSQPEQVFCEVSRVLKPGGRFFAVLEDMEPTWADLLGGTLFNFSSRQVLEILSWKLRCSLLRQQWPIAGDHIRTPEPEIQSWSAPYFTIIRRAWIGPYLTYEFQNRPVDNSA